MLLLPERGFDRQWFGRGHFAVPSPRSVRWMTCVGLEQQHAPRYVILLSLMAFLFGLRIAPDGLHLSLRVFARCDDLEVLLKQGRRRVS